MALDDHFSLEERYQPIIVVKSSARHFYVVGYGEAGVFCNWATFGPGYIVMETVDETTSIF
jgi:hypothetical protein